MRRNDDLIRKLMLDLENANEHVTDKHLVDGFGRNEVAYHLALIVKSGYAEGKTLYGNASTDTTIPSAVVVIRLTPSGHDFISTVRDPKIWSKVKERAASVAGGVTLEILKQLGSAVLKQHLGLP
ncbi:DUF2513 domain-containing protein [Dyella monticola]|uniref:DUF2513 domain-containing protein n=1 Tax=Dyella monticola TaxID=1927958 RepID=A0A370WXW3_9GAMM|nr:DUF2513 domain-containing protein [Dyella monticola]RDS80871.1 DUF2513 domain-containing protein [Dyella monticola]